MLPELRMRQSFGAGGPRLACGLSARCDEGEAWRLQYCSTIDVFENVTLPGDPAGIHRVGTDLARRMVAGLLKRARAEGNGREKFVRSMFERGVRLVIEPPEIVADCSGIELGENR